MNDAEGFKPTEGEVADKVWLRTLSPEALAEELWNRTMAARRALAVHIEAVDDDVATFEAQAALARVF